MGNNKLDVFTKRYNKGAVKMVSVKEFIMSLKLMSMKKMVIKKVNLLSMERCSKIIIIFFIPIF